jgi:hypothetical protein
VPSSSGKGPGWKKYRDYGTDAAVCGLFRIRYLSVVASETQTQLSSTVSASVEIEKTVHAQQGYPTLYPKTAWRLDLPPFSQLLGSPLSRRAQKATVHIVRRMHLNSINGYIREECTTGPLRRLHARMHPRQLRTSSFWTRQGTTTNVIEHIFQVAAQRKDLPPPRLEATRWSRVLPSWKKYHRRGSPVNPKRT